MKKANENDYFIDKIERTFLFSGLSKDEYEILANNSTEVRYNKGDIIYKHSSYSTHAIYLLDGYAKIYLEIGDRKRIVKIIKPNWFVGLLSIFSHEKFDFTATAIEDLVVQYIDKEALIHIIHKNGDFAIKFIKEISLLSTSLTKFLVLQNQKNVRGRIAEIILHLADNIFMSNRFGLFFTRKELGDLANTSTETSIRILNEFKNEGIVNIDKRIIEIKDIEMLRRISEVS